MHAANTAPTENIDQLSTAVLHLLKSKTINETTNASSISLDTLLEKNYDDEIRDENKLVRSKYVPKNKNGSFATSIAARQTPRKTLVKGSGKRYSLMPVEDNNNFSDSDFTSIENNGGSNVTDNSKRAPYRHPIGKDRDRRFDTPAGGDMTLTFLGNCGLPNRTDNNSIFSPIYYSLMNDFFLLFFRVIYHY